MHELIHASLREAATGLERLRYDTAMLTTIERAGKALAAAFKAGNRVFSCGNGGSMCDAMHFAEELSGRYRGDRPALAAQAISDVGHMSCVANDYGYDNVFARYLQAHGREGDILLAISTSGTSRNVLKAVCQAQVMGMNVVGLSGSAKGFPVLISYDDGSSMSIDPVDFDIHTPAGKYADRVQELHIKVIHILIEIVEREMGYT